MNPSTEVLLIDDNRFDGTLLSEAIKFLDLAQHIECLRWDAEAQSVFMNRSRADQTLSLRAIVVGLGSPAELSRCDFMEPIRAWATAQNIPVVVATPFPLCDERFQPLAPYPNCFMLEKVTPFKAQLAIIMNTVAEICNAARLSHH
jgi:hypothetical protein